MLLSGNDPFTIFHFRFATHAAEIRTRSRFRHRDAITFLSGQGRFEKGIHLLIHTGSKDVQWTVGTFSHRQGSPTQFFFHQHHGNGIQSASTDLGRKITAMKPQLHRLCFKRFGQF